MWRLLVVSLALLFFTDHIDGEAPPIGAVKYEGPTNRTIVNIIVARYSESMKDMMWIKDFPHVVYNRGEPFKEEEKGLNSVDLTYYANCGREPYVYFSHIIHNYDRLADINIFTLAHHKADESKGYTHDHLRRDVADMIDGKLPFGPRNDGFMYLAPICTNLEDYLGQRVDYYNKKYGIDNFNILWDGYADVLNFTQPGPRRFAPPVFAVTKEAILRNSKAFYFSQAKMLSREIEPPAAHFFRRAWWAVFRSKCQYNRDYDCHHGDAPKC